MTTRFKLSIAGISFLAFNGVTLLTIDNQFNILDSLRDITSRGGHLLTQLSLFNLNSPSNKSKLDIEVGKASKGVHFDSSSAKLQDTKLELKINDSNQLGLNSEFLDLNSVNKISEVFSEIQKEEK